MPRPKNEILHALLDKNDKNDTVCNNENCKNKTLNNHTGNLERHLKQVHPKIYSKYIEQKNLKNIKKTPLKTKMGSKDLNRNNIELAIVELFTRNGRPLHMAEDRAFKILVQPVFDALGISVNEHNINERIIGFSQTLKEDIIKDLKGKLVSLKIDAATRQDLSVLGINVQYIKDKSIQIKTLAVKELKLSHTSEYLKSVILEVLKEYAIDISQILTITTDNGANMLKAVKDLNVDLQNSLEEENVDNNEDMEDIDCTTVEKMESIQSNFTSYNITGVRCGAHTLQLCVHDVMKTAEVKAKLEKCRSVVKKLRTQTYLNFIKNGRYKKPIIDCVTRWNSTFLMLKRLKELRDIIELLSLENDDLYLGPDEWNFVNDFVDLFKPIYLATLKLQSEQLYFSELYIVIMEISFQMEGLPSSEMKTLVMNSLNKRKTKLLDSELFNAAVYLDPRIKICMNSEQKAKAKQYISSLYNRMNSLKEIASEPINVSIKDENLEVSSSSNRSVVNSFSEFLQNLDPNSPEPISSLLSHMEADFMLYERLSRLPLDSNILEYWSVQSNSLSVIANIILAIPSTQVSVERLFSALKYILSDQRNRLTAFNVEHILMVKANGIFNYED